MSSRQDLSKLRTAIQSDMRRLESYLTVCPEKDKEKINKHLQSLSAALSATYEGKEE